ncbi:MAG: tetratricopeptide repeat protein [Spirochaetota bacterium]
MYTQGEFRYALEYFHRANNYEYETPMLILYMGMSYEQIGKYNDARKNYERALRMDPNNNDIIVSLSRVRKKIDDSRIEYESMVRRNQTEVEEGEVIPLPINQNAFDKRLSDKELERYAPLGNGNGRGKYDGKYDKPPDEEPDPEPAEEE